VMMMMMMMMLLCTYVCVCSISRTCWEPGSKRYSCILHGMNLSSSSPSSPCCWIF
jgi:hypothetical protein